MNRIRRPDSQAGQVSAEYLIECLLVMALLLADAGSGDSLLALIGAAIRDGFERFATALSLT